MKIQENFLTLKNLRDFARWAEIFRSTQLEKFDLGVSFSERSSETTETRFFFLFFKEQNLYEEK